MLGCDEDIGQDLTELFNYLTGYSPPPSYRKILAAPYTLKRGLIERSTARSSTSAATAGLIQMKMNALEDPDITRALYSEPRRGQGGPHRARHLPFRPGLPGISDNGRVISIVGRFLEHGRIIYFRNGGEEEYFIGSADMMGRNLDSRVEVHAPVENPELRQELRLILDVQLADQRSAWDMDSRRQLHPAPPARRPSAPRLARRAHRRRRAAVGSGAALAQDQAARLRPPRPARTEVGTGRWDQEYRQAELRMDGALTPTLSAAGGEWRRALALARGEAVGEGGGHAAGG